MEISGDVLSAEDLLRLESVDARISSPNINFSVTGAVDDVRPWLSRATAMVVPLTIGGGTRLKIVEAMAMECPVVSTRIGAEGLGMQHGRELLLADGDAEFARATLAALEDAQAARERAQTAAAFVRQNLTWSRLAQRLARVWREVSGLG